jgi:Superfamily I DNA and RNA helicases
MLDNFQLRFCKADDGNIRLLAPAGSGKTHSLLWRCKYIFERKRGSAKFLVVTFTRAARDELRKRLGRDSSFADCRGSIEVTTLNGWGFKRVRQNHHSPRLNTTEADRSFCVQNSLQPVWRRHPLIETAINHQQFSAGKVVMNLIDLFKSLAFDHRKDLSWQLAHLNEISELGLQPILEAGFRDLAALGIGQDMPFEKIFTEFVAFWQEAVTELIEQALFTLEDQKYVAWIDLQEQLAAGRKPVGGARFTHVLVDEFQDVNPLDLALVDVIASLNDSYITIVGDDDQAIFEWRGATYAYIVDPARHLKREFDTIILENNYRCPANIVDHSQRLIRHNKLRVDKNVIAKRSDQATIDVLSMPDFAASIDNVVNIIREFREAISTGAKDSDAKLALISRKRAQLIPYQILLASEGIPFCAAEDLQVFMSNTFESLIDVLSICDEARGRPRPRRIVDDVLTLCDVVKRFKLSKKDRASLRGHLVSASPRSYSEAVDALEMYRGELKGKNEDGAMSRSFAGSLRPLFEADAVSDILDRIGSLAGMEKDYGKSNEDIFFADPPFFYLSRFAERYGDDLARFIEDLESAKQQIVQVPVDEDEEQRAVGGGQSADIWARPIHLMTALRSKGKEFDTVVMLDVNDGIWPTVHAETDRQKEQERRLFYVAMTRAKSRLVMTLSGRIDQKIMSRSPFLAEAGIA